MNEPKQTVVLMDKIQIEAKCNNCKSSNIAIVVNRIPLNRSKEIDCDEPVDHAAYNCVTCNVIVCNSCDHNHRMYWSGEDE